MKKNFFAAALALGTATLASALLSAPAKAQVSATVPITVDIEPIVYLETYQSLNFKPSLADLSTGAAAAGTPIQTVAGIVDFTTGAVNNALAEGATVTGFTPSKSVNNVLVYKVWGIGGTNGTIAHSAAYTGNLVKNASTIGLTVAPNAATPTSPTPAPGLDYAGAIPGALDFTFNFTGIKESGTHSGGTLTITATAQ
jgi:hypothetical protein